MLTSSPLFALVATTLIITAYSLPASSASILLNIDFFVEISENDSSTPRVGPGPFQNNTGPATSSLGWALVT
ncbi:hypothetical protein B0H14DRAFT_2884633 [Mycena olivaceomarginata]|nr:hypothetical protein B0H14DRAFT_2884633 [Mycena olivaceomarginata]